ncbi:transposable element Tc1 transposase [Trichonephila clavipes]|nr:transposable element Tc1 transposase [Trichonephila clavipes]
MRPLNRCWQEWVDRGRFERPNGSDQPRATADRDDRLSVRSIVTTPDSSLSTIRRATRLRVRVWRRLRQRVDPAFTIVRHTYLQPGVIVWGAISFDCKTLLVVNRGTLSAQRYIDDILRTVLLPFLLQYPGLIFQHDNARPHTAHIVMNCVTACQTLPWPAKSPDIYPWSMSGILWKDDCIY